MAAIRSFVDKSIELAAYGVTNDDDFREGCALVFFVLTFIMVGFTFTKIDDCDAEPMIPIWIIVLGSCLLIQNVIEFLRRRHKTISKLPTDENEEVPKIKTFPFGLALTHFVLGIFIILWFTIGCFWVFNAFPKKSLCDFYVFNIAFGLILCAGVFSSLIICLIVWYFVIEK